MRRIFILKNIGSELTGYYPFCSFRIVFEILHGKLPFFSGGQAGFNSAGSGTVGLISGNRFSLDGCVLSGSASFEARPNFFGQCRDVP